MVKDSTKTTTKRLLRRMSGRVCWISLMTRNFPDADGHFQQDLAPCQTSRKMSALFEKKWTWGFRLAWKLSRFNPIENIWAIIKQRLLKEDYSTMAKIIIAVIITRYHDEEMSKICSTLVEYMQNCVHMLVKEKGGHTCYQLYHILYLLHVYLNKN